MPTKLENYSVQYNFFDIHCAFEHCNLYLFLLFRECIVPFVIKTSANIQQINIIG